MTPYRDCWQSDDGAVTLDLGDCRNVLPTLAADSVDSCVCDPPYELAFMGKHWDAAGVAFDPATWEAVYRVLKPGAHLLAFGGTRTFHRLACAIEDAGFEIRDCIMWVYGSGFPKSGDISKMIDKQEQKRWLDVCKAIDGIEKNTIIEAWKEHSSTVKSAGLSFRKNETATGTNTQKSGSVAEHVLLQAKPKSSHAVAIIAELNFCEARHTSEASTCFVQSSAVSNSTELNSLATNAESLPASLEATPAMPSSSALTSAWGWQSERTMGRLKAVEALKTWLGSKPLSKREATSALCAALTDDLKLIMLSQSRTFQSYDTTQQTDCVSAITATITESTAESLILFMADTLRREAIDKAAGAEREVVGRYIRPDGSAPRNNTTSTPHWSGEFATGNDSHTTAPATEAAKQWAGWGTSLKPSFEPVIWATKPLSNLGDCVIIIQNLTQMEAELCKRIASVAAKSSQPIQHGLSEARGDSVQTPAPIQAGVAVGNETGTGAAGVTSWAAAISGSTPEAAHIALNTISLWRRTLEDALSLANTCTTETASSLITDLKTWSLSLSQITLDNIIQAAFHPSGLIAPVSNAAQYFSVVSAKSNAIRELIAQGLVTGSSEIRPAWEPIILARKPLQGTVAECVLAHGCGAINVDGCRVGTEERPHRERRNDKTLDGEVYGSGINGSRSLGTFSQGRWPANLIHDGSDEVVGLFPETGDIKGRVCQYSKSDFSGDGGWGNNGSGQRTYNGSGSAARFFYCAKASKAERNGSKHPTVKPLALMRYLVRLVTPPGGLVLDPFLGSGTTAAAALQEGFRVLGIEREDDYYRDAVARVERERETRPLLKQRELAEVCA